MIARGIAQHLRSPTSLQRSGVGYWPLLLASLPDEPPDIEPPDIEPVLPPLPLDRVDALWPLDLPERRWLDALVPELPEPLDIEPLDIEPDDPEPLLIEPD